jgi:iron complex outermembrane receptor protein
VNIIATDGKQVVDSPKKMFASEVVWARNGLTLQLGAKYTDRRYITYLNDSSVPGFWVADAGAAYEWTSLGMFESLRLKLDVTNLLDKEYFSSLGTNGFVVSDPNGLNYTLMAGAPRQVFLTAELRF